MGLYLMVKAIGLGNEVSVVGPPSAAGRAKAVFCACKKREQAAARVPQKVYHQVEISLPKPLDETRMGKGPTGEGKRGDFLPFQRDYFFKVWVVLKDLTERLLSEISDVSLGKGPVNLADEGCGKNHISEETKTGDEDAGYISGGDSGHYSSSTTISWLV